MVATPITAPESTKKVQAEQLGSIAKEVTGTWSYWDGNKDVVQTNKMLLDKLPTRANQGTYRFTTDNYDANTNIFIMIKRLEVYLDSLRLTIQ